MFHWNLFLNISINLWIKMPSLRSICSVILKNRLKISVIWYRCSFEKYIRIEKGMLWWFAYMERMSESWLTKEIYRGVVEGSVKRRRLRKFYTNQISDDVFSILIKYIKLEPNIVCLNRIGWNSVVFTYS